MFGGRKLSDDESSFRNYDTLLWNTSRVTKLYNVEKVLLLPTLDQSAG